MPGTAFAARLLCTPCAEGRPLLPAASQSLVLPPGTAEAGLYSVSGSDDGSLAQAVFALSSL